METRDSNDLANKKMENGRAREKQPESGTSADQNVMKKKACSSN